ncbi:MAG: hypothetical protein AB8B57_00020 [Congregibacter sp.]
MEGFWKKAVTATGPVGVIAFVLTIFIENVYQEEVLQQFGSANAFHITMAIFALLAATLVLALLMYRTPVQREQRSAAKNVRTSKISRSQVNGDIVLGDKTINMDKNRDE